MRNITVRPDELPPLVRKAYCKALKDAGHRVAAAEDAQKPLSDHLNDYEQYLKDAGRSDKHVSTLISRIRNLLDACKFRLWSDLSASRVQSFVAELGESPKGRSIQTSNFYLQGIMAMVAAAGGTGGTG